MARLSTFIGASGASAGTARNITQTLRVIRDHLGMDVAFVSEFHGDQRVFRYVDSKAADPPLRVGTTLSMKEGYCRLVVDGKLPQLIPDTAAVPLAAAMEITRSFPIGAHLSVPIRLSDGSMFGTFCCFSYKPDHTLNDRDLSMLRAFAELTAAHIDYDLQTLRDREDKVARIQTAIDGHDISIVYQPIHRLDDNHIVGFECLARFSAQPYRPPDQWFTEAAEIGLAAELELAALKIAIRALNVLPRNLFLSLNVSPEVVLVDGLGSLLEGAAIDRIVIELTEHAPVADYGRLSDAIDKLRRRGAKLAIDDAGAGYASLRHILSLRPDLIKLDISLIRGIDLDTDKQALASALIEFAKKTGADIIAEGVETASELTMLRSLQVGLAQGYLLNRPMGLADALQAADAARTQVETPDSNLSPSPRERISTSRGEGI